MVASPYLRPDGGTEAPAQSHRSRHLDLIQGSLSARRVARRVPWLGGLHRAVDGALAGVGLSMLALSALTLHWQSQWSGNYQTLDGAQVLEQRLQESSALLEHHHLASVGRRGWVEPTSSSRLIHLPPPPEPSRTSLMALLRTVSGGPISPGY